MTRYDDIINLPHHVSDKRPQMSMHDRAAQFSPFAALTGYEDAVAETGRRTMEKLCLDEDALTLLDYKLQILADKLDDRPQVAVTYFKPDERKQGGAYVLAEGTVKRIHADRKCLIMTDGTVIPIADIIALDGAIFNAAESAESGADGGQDLRRAK